MVRTATLTRLRRARSVSVGLAVCAGALLLGAPGRAQPVAPDEEQPLDEPAPPPPPPVAPGTPAPPSPPWTWRQVATSTRVGGVLTALAVNLRDANHVVVGTQHGTVLVSHDGGVTWDEREVSPSIVDPSTTVARQPEPPAGVRTPLSSPRLQLPRFDVDPFGQSGPRSLASPATGVIETDTAVNVSLNPLRRPRGLLFDAVGGRPESAEPVRAVAVCPGGRHALLVATSRELFGSSDDGVTFVPLFTRALALLRGSTRNPFERPIDQVVCSPANPNDIVLATGEGAMRSVNGGLTFGEIHGLPVEAVTGLAFDLPAAAEGSTPALLVAMADSLYAGDPDSEEGLQFIFPDPDDPTGMPYEAFRAMATTGSAQIWVGTDDGVRMSPDGGEHWRHPAAAEFARQRVSHVAAGRNGRGGTRVAIALESRVLATDDDGRTWQPFFDGAARHPITSLAVVDAAPEARWWVISEGELFTTAPRAARAFDRAAAADAAWARRRLRVTPPLGTAIELTFARAALRGVGLGQVFRDVRFVPRLAVVFAGGERPYLERTLYTVTDVGMLARTRGEIGYEVFVRATWYFGSQRDPRRALRDEAQALDRMRAQLRGLVTDAWHDRVERLRALALMRVATPLQREIYRARIEADEALLEVWTGRPPLAEGVE